MKHRHRFLFALGVWLTVVLAAPAAPPTTSPSHRPVPGTPVNPNDLDAALAKRVGQAQDLNSLDDLAQKLLKDFKPSNFSKEDLENLQKIADKHKIDGKPLKATDPELAKLAKDKPEFGKILDKIKNMKNGEVHAEDLEAIKKLGEKPQGETPDLNNPQILKLLQEAAKHQASGSANSANLDDLLKKLDFAQGNPAGTTTGPDVPPETNGLKLTGAHTGTDSGKTGAGTGAGSVALPKPDGTQPPQNPLNPGTPDSLDSVRPTWMNKLMLDLADHISELDGGAKDSLSSLLTDMAKDYDTKSPSVQGFINSVAKASDAVPTDKINQAGSWFGKIRMPALSKFDDMTQSSQNLPAVPVGTASGDGAVPALIGALVVLVAGYVVWKILASYKTALANKANDPWKLGAWPIHPSMVRTRADVVKAFEYLALLCLGRSAETRNHLEIGDEIGRQASWSSKSNEEQRDRRTEAAQALAHLYEIARYTPDDETLPPDELATARRELSFLAGAVSA